MGTTTDGTGARGTRKAYGRAHNIIERDGRYMGLVRVAGFKPMAKTFPSKSEAKEWVDKTKRELKEQKQRGAVRRDVTQLTVADLIKEYLDESTTKAQRSFSDTERLLGWWVNKFGTERLLEFGVQRIRSARGELQKGTRRKARGPATINRYMSALRSCWNWGIAAGLLPDTRPWPKRLMHPEPKGRVRFLSDDELASLREAAVKVYGPQLFALMLVSIATGARQSEVLRLKWSDVDFRQSKITVLLAKNGDARSVYLPPAGADALQALRKLDVVSAVNVFVDPRDGKPFNKSKLRYRWKLARKEAALKDFRWHDLRHSCASLLAQNGATLLEIGSVLGHKSPSSTMRYAHLVQGAPVKGHDMLNSKLTAK